jgi:hypothetical protein
MTNQRRHAQLLAGAGAASAARCGPAEPARCCCCCCFAPASAVDTRSGVGGGILGMVTTSEAAAGWSALAARGLDWAYACRVRTCMKLREPGVCWAHLLRQIVAVGEDDRRRGQVEAAAHNARLRRVEHLLLAHQLRDGSGLSALVLLLLVQPALRHARATRP